MYDFLRGFKNVNEMEIKVILCGQKVKITDEVISKMLQLPSKGPNTKLLNPLQEGRN